MIYVSGVATFLLNESQENKEIVRKQKTLTLEQLKEVERVPNSSKSVRIRYQFRAILPESVDCRSLEDYTGKIKPFLQEAKKVTVISVEVHHLNYTDRRKID